MPIYEFRCNECNDVWDKMLSISQRKEPQTCPTCSTQMKRLISAPAKTATLWHGNWSEGLSSNLYSKALGQRVSSRRQEEEIMRSKGFIPESDLGDGYLDKVASDRQQAAVEQDKINDEYKANLKKFNGDKIKAVEETFPAHKMLSDNPTTDY